MMMHKGSCLCGAVKIRVDGPLTSPDACHCTACRKTSGHFLVSCDLPRERVHVEGEVTWYASSQKVRRGFCGICGSTLFWDPVERDWTSVALGAFDGPTDVSIHVHVFVGEKGDYYEIGDGVPQAETIPSP